MDQKISQSADTRLLLLALACLAALSGCSHHGDGADPELEAGTLPVTTDAGGDAGTRGSTDGNVGTDSFSVRLETDRVARVCLGACAALTAQADHGVPPYRYVFDHRLGEGAGPHQVCPTQTTTYQVSASDSSFDGEFGSHNGKVSQSISIEVDPSCVPGVDSGTDAGTAEVKTPGSPICTQPVATVAMAEDPDSYFQSTPGLQWQRSLRIDANDDIVLMVAAGAGSNFGGGALGANSAAVQDPTIVVLAKYHANGDHVWSKLLQEAPTRVSMAIQNGTDIVFHGWADQARNWGAAGRTNGSLAGQGHGYLVRANSAGNFVWSKRVSDGNLEQYAWHWLEVAPNNQLVLSNFAVSGELVLGSSNADVSWAKLVIDPTFGFSDSWSKTGVDGRGNILVGGGFTSPTSVNGVALTAPTNAAQNAFVQKLDATGAVRWTYQSNGLTPEQGASKVLLGLAADPQADVFAVINYSDFDGRALYLVKLAR